jgi:hypothetical protein
MYAFECSLTHRACTSLSLTFFLCTQSEDDVPYEEDLLKQPFVVSHWLRYLNHKADAPPAQRFILYERAVRGTDPRLLSHRRTQRER